jgi:hypothetical protein
VKWAAPRKIAPDASSSSRARTVVTEDELLGTVTWEGPAGDSPSDAEVIPMPSEQLEMHGLKEKLCGRIRELTELTEIQAKLYAMFSSYSDVLVSRKAGLAQRREMHRAYLLHVLNHVIKSRDLVNRHNAKKNMARQERRTADVPAD